MPANRPAAKKPTAKQAKRDLFDEIENSSCHALTKNDIMRKANRAIRLAVEEEREACARIAEPQTIMGPNIAADIRARGRK